MCDTIQHTQWGGAGHNLAATIADEQAKELSDTQRLVVVDMLAVTLAVALGKTRLYTLVDVDVG